MPFLPEKPQNIYVAAHRGFSAKYPENTMPAFRAAAALGVDQLETDVQLTKDGQLVILHDATVDRTTNGSGRIRELTLSEVKKLDAGKPRGMEKQGYTVPTLEEFLDFLKTLPDMTLDLELKVYPAPGEEALAFDACDRAIAAAQAAGYADRMVINTFSGALHLYIEEHYGASVRRHVYFPFPVMTTPAARFGLCKGNPFVGAYCCCMFRTLYNDGINMATKAEFDAVAQLGVQPWAGTCVKDEKTVEMAIDRGAKLITCNNPDEVLALLRQKGYHA